MESDYTEEQMSYWGQTAEWLAREVESNLHPAIVKFRDPWWWGFEIKDGEKVLAGLNMAGWCAPSDVVAYLVRHWQNLS